MSNKSNATIATMGIDIGKNSFHVVGLDQRGAIVLRQKWSRSQVGARLAVMPPCLIGMEAFVGAHHLSRKLQAHSHDARLMPAKYVRAYNKGQKNDFRDAEAIAEAVQRPTMKFVATKTVDQLDLQALHRVRERLVRQHTGIINQIRAFLLERGIAVRQGARGLRAELPGRAQDAANYAIRQYKHAYLNPTESYTFDILERLPPGSRPLNVAEEDWIRAGAGPWREGGPLENDIHAMTDAKYRKAEGTIPYP
jgi:transposase